MENTRRFERFSTKLKGQYLLEGKTGDWEKCTIVKISITGMGVEFHSQEKIIEGSTVHIAITSSKEPDPIIVKGVLTWIKQRRNDSIGGIELTEMLDEITFAKLS